MKTKNRDLHGSAPDHSGTVMLIADMISDFKFEDGPKLLRRVMPVARRIAALKKRAHQAGVPAIYVNDNFGRWRSDAEALVKYCSREKQPGAEVVRVLAPAKDDYFIIKPKHSGFFATALDTLLTYIDAERLIVTGVSSHQCVLFTANDAYVRDFELVIPRDCIAAPSPRETSFALKYFKMVLGADTRRSSLVELNGRSRS